MLRPAAARVARMSFDVDDGALARTLHPTDALDVHHARAASARESFVIVGDEYDAATHSRREVATDVAEDDHVPPVMYSQP